MYDLKLIKLLDQDIYLNLLDNNFFMWHISHKHTGRLETHYYMVDMKVPAAS